MHPSLFGMVGKGGWLAALGLALLLLGWRWALPAAVSAPLSADEVVRRMVAMNASRTSALHAFSATRIYHVDYQGLGHQSADMTVRVDYRQPGPKKFTILAEAGSGMLRHHVLEPLVKAEQKDAETTREQGLAIVPANYRFELLPQPDGATASAYVLRAKPRSGRNQRFLFRGTLWVNPDDYGIERIQGVIDDVPSFWVTHAEFDYQNQKVGAFWLPDTNRTVAHLRWFGHALLTIRYGGFQFTSTSPVPPMVAGGQP